MLRIFTVLAFVFYGSFVMAQDFPETSWTDVADTSWYVESADSFEIDNAESFAGLSVLVAEGNDFAGKTFSITSDVDLGAHLWLPIGVNFDNSFSGNVNGNGNKILNLYVNRPDNDFAGLFGSVLNAQIHHLNIENAVVLGLDTVGALVANLSTNSEALSCRVTNAIVQGAPGGNSSSIGGLVGGLLTDSTVKWSSFSGEVSGSLQIGGLVGTAWDHTLIEESYSEGMVTGDNIVGGLVGFTTFNFPPVPGRENTLRNSYSRSDVTVFGESAGGLYGSPQDNAIIENCYSTGLVQGAEKVGGSIGSIMGTTVVFNTYFDIETSGNTEGIGDLMGAGPAEVFGKTSEEMKTQELADLLNAEQGTVWIWNESENDGYPILTDNNQLSVIDVITIDSGFAVYPTLADFEINIQSKTKAEFGIYDLSGRQLLRKKLSANTPMSINVSHLAKGVYFVVFEGENQKGSIRFIKK